MSAAQHSLEVKHSIQCCQLLVSVTSIFAYFLLLIYRCMSLICLANGRINFQLTFSERVIELGSLVTEPN